MKFQFTIERDDDGARLTACPSSAGCFSSGEARDLALLNIGSAIHERLEVRAESAPLA